MSDLNELAREAHQNAVNHGFWDPEPSFGETIALCHSELSEALEEYRNRRPLAYVFRSVADEWHKDGACMETDISQWTANDKPEGIAVEMADCLIRILDWCGGKGVDIDAIVRAKIAYNRNRPYRHGGKAL